MEQIWKPIPDFPGYEITQDGKVRSFRFGKKARLVKHRDEPTGYVRFGLMREGRQVWRFAHRLAWEAHIGPIGEGLVINHKNGVKNDNRLENLEAVTHSENVKHSFRVLGASPNIYRQPGEANPLSRLTNDIISRIRAMREETGLPYAKIGAHFGICASTAHRICTGKAWRHI